MTTKNISLSVHIIDAIKSDDIEQLKTLLTDNPDQLRCNTFFIGQTWLGYAASIGKLEAMKLLVALGADINQGDHRENVKPICAAASNDQVESVEFLLKNGSILDTETSVQNPLFAAVVGRSPEVTKLLLEAGIDSTVRYNTKTMKNMDAMAFALMQGEKSCAEIIANWIADSDKTKFCSLLKEADEIAEHNAYGRNWPNK